MSIKKLEIFDSACLSSDSSVLRTSSVRVALAATTFVRLGCMSILPTVQTWSPPIVIASLRMKTVISAAMYAGSWRSDIGVVPAWFDCPIIVTSCHEIPCTLVTAPMRTLLASSIGPCSICNSTNACGIKPGQGVVPAYPMRTSSSPSFAPSIAITSNASSSARPPTYTSEPSMSGAKRAPSSSVKMPTASGRGGVTPAF